MLAMSNLGHRRSNTDDTTPSSCNSQEKMGRVATIILQDLSGLRQRSIKEHGDESKSSNKHNYNSIARDLSRRFSHTKNISKRIHRLSRKSITQHNTDVDEANEERNEHAATTIQPPPPSPAKIVIWAVHCEEGKRIETNPSYLCSYPVIEEESVDDDDGNITSSWGCVWSDDACSFDVPIPSSSSSCIRLAVGLQPLGENEVQLLGVADIRAPEDGQSEEMNLVVPLSPLQKTTSVFDKVTRMGSSSSKRHKEKECEYIVSKGETVLNNVNVKLHEVISSQDGRVVHPPQPVVFSYDKVEDSECQDTSLATSLLQTKIVISDTTSTTVSADNTSKESNDDKHSKESVKDSNASETAKSTDINASPSNDDDDELTVETEVLDSAVGEHIIIIAAPDKEKEVVEEKAEPTNDATSNPVEAVDGIAPLKEEVFEEGVEQTTEVPTNRHTVLEDTVIVTTPVEKEYKDENQQQQASKQIPISNNTGNNGDDNVLILPPEGTKERGNSDGDTKVKQNSHVRVHSMSAFELDMASMELEGKGKVLKEVKDLVDDDSLTVGSYEGAIPHNKDMKDQEGHFHCLGCEMLFDDIFDEMLDLATCGIFTKENSKDDDITLTTDCTSLSSHAEIRRKRKAKLKRKRRRRKKHGAVHDDVVDNLIYRLTPEDRQLLLIKSKFRCEEGALGDISVCSV